MSCEIWHGDSTKLAWEIEGPIDLICTDPPYGMKFKSEFPVTPTGKKFSQEIENDGDIDEALETFFKAMLPLVDKAADDADMYVFTRWSLLGPWMEAVNQLAPFEVKNLLIWDKGTPGMGDIRANWCFNFECIIYAKKGRVPIKRRRSNIIAIDRTPGNHHIHPTEKPVALLELLIDQSTQPGALVVDPFAGSGSTIVAAQRSGRRGIGIESDETFHQRASARLDQQLFAI